MFKSLVKVGLVGLVALSMSGCTSDEEKYIGKWSDKKFSVEFFPKNECQFLVKNKIVVPLSECNWKINNNIVELTSTKESKGIYFSVSDNYMLMDKKAEDLTKDKADSVLTKIAK